MFAFVFVYIIIYICINLQVIINTRVFVSLYMYAKIYICIRIDFIIYVFLYHLYVLVYILPLSLYDNKSFVFVFCFYFGQNLCMCIGIYLNGGCTLTNHCPNWRNDKSKKSFDCFHIFILTTPERGARISYKICFFSLIFAYYNMQTLL